MLLEQLKMFMKEHTCVKHILHNLTPNSLPFSSLPFLLQIFTKHTHSHTHTLGSAEKLDWRVTQVVPTPQPTRTPLPLASRATAGPVQARKRDRQKEACFQQASGSSLLTSLYTQTGPRSTRPHSRASSNQLSHWNTLSPK